jgi:release factor glutamine methyltransferase
LAKLVGSSVGTQLAWAAERFRSLGHETPRLDAEVLLAHVLSCQRIQLYTGFDGEVSAGDAAEFLRLVEAAASGCPVAYLVGKKDFYTLTFEIDRSVLIPRPETEYLVIAALEFAEKHPVERVLDVGTGSGILAITLATELSEAAVWAVDCSQAALAVAARNARRHRVADRIQFRKSNLYAALPPELRFDVIVSNPPYVSAAEWDQLPLCVRDFEPRTALDGGADGLDAIRRVLSAAPDRLLPTGRLFLEIGAGQSDAVADLVASVPELALLDMFKDLAGHRRVVACEKKV